MHVVSFVTLKGFRIVHIPCSLVGYEPQFVAIFLNCAHDVCQSSPRVRLSLPWRLTGSVLRESDDARGEAQRENGQSEFSWKEPPCLLPRHFVSREGGIDRLPRVKSSRYYAVA